jgi:hypothetical protein
VATLCSRISNIACKTVSTGTDPKAQHPSLQADHVKELGILKPSKAEIRNFVDGSSTPEYVREKQGIMKLETHKSSTGKSKQKQCQGMSGTAPRSRQKKPNDGLMQTKLQILKFFWYHLSPPTPENIEKLN